MIKSAKIGIHPATKMLSKILSIGNAYFEIDCIHFPIDKLALNKEISGSEYDVYVGGSAMNFARLCNHLGFSTYFIGKIGRDTTGEAVQKMLQNEGVNFYPIISNKHQTNLALNFVGNNGDQYLFIAGTAAKSLEIKEIEVKLKEIVSEIKYLYLGGIFKFRKLLPELEDLINFAQKNQIIVILDHNRITNEITLEERDIMRDIVPIVDYYLPSKDEVLELYGKSAMEDLNKIRTKPTVIKDADNGAVGFSKGELFHVPAFKVKVRNTVGAGDSFNSGFIKAIDDGKNFEEAIRYGCAAAALNISQEGYPTFEEVKNYVR